MTTQSVALTPGENTIRSFFQSRFPKGGDVLVFRAVTSIYLPAHLCSIEGGKGRERKAGERGREGRGRKRERKGEGHKKKREREREIDR